MAEMIPLNYGLTVYTVMKHNSTIPPIIWTSGCTMTATWKSKAVISKCNHIHLTTCMLLDLLVFPYVTAKDGGCACTQLGQLPNITLNLEPHSFLYSALLHYSHPGSSTLPNPAQLTSCMVMTEEYEFCAELLALCNCIFLFYLCIYDSNSVKQVFLIISQYISWPQLLNI